MKKALVIFVAATLSLTVSGCDSRKCLDWHTTVVPVTTVDMKGNVLFSTSVVTQCIEWESRDEVER